MQRQEEHSKSIPRGLFEKHRRDPSQEVDVGSSGLRIIKKGG